MVDKVSKILARTEPQDSSCVLLENLLRLPAAPVVVDWLRGRVWLGVKSQLHKKTNVRMKN